ncbi:MAG: Uma2 family endonuclease [Pirellulaceae bacterium]|nr:Uma2 family endonuclease [Pirellulaceae bacterium]
MSTVRQDRPISVQDFLRGEQSASRKHEYVEGTVYAMVGGTNAHNRIATNGTVALGTRLRGRDCQVFNSDTKVRIQQARGTRFYYPDLLVACRLNPPDDTFQDAPVVLAEVISESTRRTDELEKRDAYLSIDSLCVYLLVEQTAAAVVVYRRQESGFARESYAGLESVVPLPEIGCELPLAELYDQVELPSPMEGEEA